jgi:hypothetical protein
MHSPYLLITLVVGILAAGSYLPSERLHSAMPSDGEQIQENQEGLSGQWRDNLGNIWSVVQRDTNVELVNMTSGIRFHGSLKGHTVRYIEYTTLGSTDRKECRDFIGTHFEFKARLILSKDKTLMERKAPERVRKGKCELSLIHIPSLSLRK